MRILLTNDDGIHAPGLAAMRKALASLGELLTVAPATEQSGVGHSITFLTPLMASQIYDGEELRGWAVEGSPADCVKLAIAELCRDENGELWLPDLVVSGINGGLNVGVNVLYSGTVAAATEGALNNLPSIAVSLEYDDHANFASAADKTVAIIRQMLERNAWEKHKLYNLNFSTASVQKDSEPEVRISQMGSTKWDAAFEERRDPKGRSYYWMVGTPPADPPGADTDVAAIRSGEISLTPLTVERTDEEQLAQMNDWSISVTPINTN